MKTRTDKKLTQKQRFEYIRACIHKSGEVEVANTAEILGISQETVRRDLNVLATRGELRKTHGGAVRAQSNFELAFAERLINHRYEKEAIANEAVKILSPGDSMFIDSGSTTIAFSEKIIGIKNLTVFTNSPLIAKILWELNRDANISICLLGGHYAGEYVENLGAMVLGQMKDFFVDYAFIGAGAIHSELGVMDQHHGEAILARQMLLQSRHHVVLADGSKIGQHGLVHVVGFDQVDVLITNPFIHAELTRALNKNSVRLIVCPPAKSHEVEVL
ncbi:DeoR family transcriptional regulator [Betaproteobacteria bacterium]|nr:DeoR family transcriptional regulator [Betaproteobacteria bacterium]